MNISWKVVAIGACTIIASLVVYIFLALDKRVDTQDKQIEQLSKELTVVVTIINTQIPSANIPALISAVAKNNVPPEKAAMVIPLLEKDPIKAQAYLKNQMHFSSEDINVIMEPALSIDKKLIVNKKEPPSVNQ